MIPVQYYRTIYIYKCYALPWIWSLRQKDVNYWIDISLKIHGTIFVKMNLWRNERISVRLLYIY